MSNVTINLPESVFSARRLSPEEFVRDMRLAAAIYWYQKQEISMEKGGHISPLAAYNEQTDRFLILDVSRYKYPPVWVKTADFWKAMLTNDPSSKKSRGFVFVSKSL